jgi:hypothetical protein
MRTAAEAWTALEGAMTRVIALEAQITEDCEIDLLDRCVEQIDYQLDIAIGAWADVVVLGALQDVAALLARPAGGQTDAS